MGLAFGYLIGPNSAPAVLNLVYLPMAFAAGLWIPITQLPDVVQAVAPFLPPYHFAQLALGTFGASEGGCRASAPRCARGVHGSLPGRRGVGVPA